MAKTGMIFDLLYGAEFESAGGQKFWKKIMTEGEWIHPANPDVVFRSTISRMNEWVSNFAKGIPGIVTVPIRHSDNPMDNSGTVEKLEMRGGELWGLFNIALADVANRIGKTILGSSIGVDTNFIDTKTGAVVGEVLTHVALTNTPHIEGLGDFTPIYASKNATILTLEQKDGNNASARKNGDKKSVQDKTRNFKGEKTMAMTEEELKAKEDAQIAKDAELAKREADIKAKEDAAGKVNAERQKSASDLEAERTARIALEKKVTDLESDRTKLNAERRESAVDVAVDKLVACGKVTPAEKSLLKSVILASGEAVVEFEKDGKKQAGNVMNTLVALFEARKPVVLMSKSSEPNPAEGRISYDEFREKYQAIKAEFSRGRMKAEDFGKQVDDLKKQLTG